MISNRLVALRGSFRLRLASTCNHRPAEVRLKNSDPLVGCELRSPATGRRASRHSNQRPGQQPASRHSNQRPGQPPAARPAAMARPDAP